MPHAVAVFDLDGTITGTDTYLPFLRHALWRRRPRIGRLVPLPLAALRFKRRGITDTALKEQFLRAVLGGATRTEIDVLRAGFLPKCLADVKPGAAERIAWHRARGHRLILASASLDLYVPAIAEALGFDTVLCSRTHWEAGRLTGALAGPNLKAEAKLDAVRAAIGPDGAARVYAYSDHVSDLPLLRFADEGIAVDPHAALARAAATAGLAVASWRQAAVPAG